MFSIMSLSYNGNIQNTFGVSIPEINIAMPAIAMFLVILSKVNSVYGRSAIIDSMKFYTNQKT